MRVRHVEPMGLLLAFERVVLPLWFALWAYLRLLPFATHGLLGVDAKIYIAGTRNWLRGP